MRENFLNEPRIAPHNLRQLRPHLQTRLIPQGHGICIPIARHAIDHALPEPRIRRQAKGNFRVLVQIGKSVMGLRPCKNDPALSLDEGLAAQRASQHMQVELEKVARVGFPVT